MKKSNLAKVEVAAIRELIKKIDIQAGCSALKGKKKSVGCASYTR